MAGSVAPRFSVLLPTHNRADVVGYAIQSVLRQSVQDFEVLIVGDGCTDNTESVIAAFEDKRLKWFDLPKAPFYGYANRNIALKEAKGDLIAFMAHDDIFFADHLEMLAGVLERTSKEWVYSRPLWVDLDGSVVAYPMNLENAAELEVFLKRRNTIPASCVMHRRVCFDKYGYWPEDVPKAADWHFWRRILEGGGRVNFAHWPEPTCLHFVADWRRKKAPRYVGADEAIVESRPIPPGASEQHVFFNAMAKGGDEWVAQIRKATRTAVDRFAWRARIDLVPRLAKLTKELEETSGRLEEAEARTRELRHQMRGRRAETRRLRGQLSIAARQLEAIHKSMSWRITAPLRALKRLFT